MNTSARQSSGSAVEPRLLLGDREHTKLVARKRRGAAFHVVTFVPVVLAVILILALLADVTLNSISWEAAVKRSPG